MRRTLFVQLLLGVCAFDEDALLQLQPPEQDYGAAEVLGAVVGCAAVVTTECLGISSSGDPVSNGVFHGAGAVGGDLVGKKETSTGSTAFLYASDVAFGIGSTLIIDSILPGAGTMVDIAKVVTTAGYKGIRANMVERFKASDSVFTRHASYQESLATECPLTEIQKDHVLATLQANQAALEKQATEFENSDDVADFLLSEMKNIQQLRTSIEETAGAPNFVGYPSRNMIIARSIIVGATRTTTFLVVGAATTSWSGPLGLVASGLAGAAAAKVTDHWITALQKKMFPKTMLQQKALAFFGQKSQMSMGSANFNLVVPWMRRINNVFDGIDNLKWFATLPIDRETEVRPATWPTRIIVDKPREWPSAFEKALAISVILSWDDSCVMTYDDAMEIFVHMLKANACRCIYKKLMKSYWTGSDASLNYPDDSYGIPGKNKGPMYDEQKTLKKMLVDMGNKPWSTVLPWLGRKLGLLNGRPHLGRFLTGHWGAYKKHNVDCPDSAPGPFKTC